MLEGEAEGLARKAIELALDGDITALRLCIGRVEPPRKIEGLAQNLAEEQARFNAAWAADDTDIAAVIVGEAADLIRLREPAQATLHGMI